MLISSDLKNNLQRNLTVLVLAVVLILSLFLGFNSGKSKAVSFIVQNNALSLQKGLNFFYNDQERFPTELEFSSSEIMSRYFSSFPAKDFPGKTCGQSYLYKRNDIKTYQLGFCLPQGLSGLNAGWNQFSATGK